VFGPIIIGGLGLGIGAAAALGGGTQSASAATALAHGAGSAAKAASKQAASAGQLVVVGAVVVVGALVAATVVSATVNAVAAATAPQPPAATASGGYPTLPIPTSPPFTPSPTPTPDPTTPAAPSSPDPLPSAAPPPVAALDIELTDDGDDGTGTGGRLGTVTIEVRNTDSAPITAKLRVDLPDGMTFDAARSGSEDPAWSCDPPTGASRSCVATGVPVGADLTLAIPVAISADELGARPIANLSITR
jgi:hypothetical protein